jgi:hypothetical protein
VPITTKVVSVNAAHGKVYSIQHYAKMFVSDLQQVCGIIQVSSTNKTALHDIPKILLKLV